MDSLDAPTSIPGSWYDAILGKIIPLVVEQPTESQSTQLASGAFGPQPDYTSPSAWCSMGGAENAAEMLPENVERVPVAIRGAACFYVHPTGYCQAPLWNAPLIDMNSASAADWCLSHHASAFTGSCEVFAPRYFFILPARLRTSFHGTWQC